LTQQAAHAPRGQQAGGRGLPRAATAQQELGKPPCKGHAAQGKLAAIFVFVFCY